MLKVMMPFDINSIKGTLSYANTKEVAMRKGVDIKCVDSIKIKKDKSVFCSSLYPKGSNVWNRKMEEWEYFGSCKQGRGQELL